MENKSRQIFIVSDATGQTCERVVRAAMAQFESQDIDLRIWSYVRSPEAVEKVVREAQNQEGVIVYSLVCPEEREKMVSITDSLGVVAIDILGPILDRLNDFLDAGPKNIPGLFQELITEED